MPQKRSAANASRKRRSVSRRRTYPWKKALRSSLRLLGQRSGATQVVAIALVSFAVWLAVNGIYQVIRKPTELFFPVSGLLYKSPTETWRQYAALFQRHATPTITADFLAALAQTEGSGNPIVRTYWRWSFDQGPLDMYRPASSAVGMYQITDGTFAEARRYCIHNHVAVADGPWHDPKSCWFNAFYSRVVPSHAIELTAAYLDRRVSTILAEPAVMRARKTKLTLADKQKLAAVMHLCGAAAGERYAKRGMVLSPDQRCGDHRVSSYLARVNAMQRWFAQQATAP